MIRVAIAISLFTVAFVWGGWYGVFTMAFVLTIIGLIFPPRPRRRELEAAPEWEWEKVDRARRGSNADPTRPDDDHPLLLTHEIRRKR